MFPMPTHVDPLGSKEPKGANEARATTKAVSWLLLNICRYFSLYGYGQYEHIDT